MRLPRMMSLALLVVGMAGSASADSVLYYAGDWYGNGTGNGTTTNIDGSGNGTSSAQYQQGSQANLYQEFVVGTGQTWQVSALYANHLVDPVPTNGIVGVDWTIRSGLSVGNSGTVVASGTNASFTETATGRGYNGFLEQTFQVSVSTVTLTAGTYWMNVSPLAASGTTYNTLTLGTNGVNAGPIGGYQTNYFYQNLNGTGVVQNYVTTSGPASDGIRGVSMSAVPEPSSLVLSALGLLGAFFGLHRSRRRSLAN